MILPIVNLAELPARALLAVVEGPHFVDPPPQIVGLLPPLFIPGRRIRRKEFGIIVLDGQTDADALGNGLFDFLLVNRPQRGKRGLISYEKIGRGILRAEQLLGLARQHVRRHDKAALGRDMGDAPGPPLAHDHVPHGQRVPIGLGLGKVERTEMVHNFTLRHFVEVGHGADSAKMA